MDFVVGSALEASSATVTEWSGPQLRPGEGRVSYYPVSTVLEASHTFVDEITLKPMRWGAFVERYSMRIDVSGERPSWGFKWAPGDLAARLEAERLVGEFRGVSRQTFAFAELLLAIIVYGFSCQCLGAVDEEGILLQPDVMDIICPNDVNAVLREHINTPVGGLVRSFPKMGMHTLLDSLTSVKLREVDWDRVPIVSGLERPTMGREELNTKE